MDDFKVPVHIKLLSKISHGQHTKAETTQIDVVGELFYKKAFYYLIYTESVKGVGEVKNTLKFSDKEVVILRQGAISMRQHLIPGKLTEGTYHHPLGFMETKTKATEIKFHYDLNVGEGSLSLQYKMKMQGQSFGRYKLIFNFKEVSYDHR